MRIPLSVQNFYSGRKVVFANFFIRIPSMRVSRQHTAVVDSGSPFTAISTRDALAFGLPLKHWQSGTVTRLAGSKFYKHDLEGTLSFRDSEDKIVQFRSDLIALIPTKTDEVTLREVQDIPSLIGTDSLEDNSLTFVYNPSTLTAYFERPDIVPASATEQAGTHTPR